MSFKNWSTNLSVWVVEFDVVGCVQSNLFHVDNLFQRELFHPFHHYRDHHHRRHDHHLDTQVPVQKLVSKLARWGRTESMLPEGLKWWFRVWIVENDP